jgi:two-component system, cell cycle sensor histidine kinase and response regulator CckA
VLDSQTNRTSHLFLAAFAATAFSAVTTGYLFYRSQSEHTRARSEQELESVADFRANQLAAWWRECVGVAALVLDNPGFERVLPELLRQPAKTGAAAGHFAWTNGLKPRREYRSAFLFDRDGHSRLPLLPGSAEPGDHVRGIVAATLQKRAPQLSGLHRSPEWPRRHMDLALPLPMAIGRTPGGTAPVSGVEVLEIDPASLLDLLAQPWPAPRRTAEVLLIERQGDDVVYLNQPRHSRLEAGTLRRPVRTAGLVEAQAVAVEAGRLAGVDYRGAAVVAVAHRIPGLPWTLVAKMDRDEVEAPTRRVARAIGIAAGLVIATAGALFSLLWRDRRIRFYRRQYEAEVERRALAEHYSLLTRHANDIVLLVDGEGRVREANERAAASYGYPHNELLRLRVRDLRAPETLAQLELDWERTRRRSGVVFETVHRRQDGTTFPVEVSTRPIRTGGQVFFQDIVRDISERKRAEEAMTWEMQTNEALAGVAAAMLAQSSFEEITALALSRARALTNSELGLAFHLDAQTGEDVMPVPAGAATGGLRRLCDGVLQSGRPLLSNEGLAADSAIRRFLCAPAAIGGAVAGAIAVANSSRDYTARDLALVERLTRLYALAVERLRHEAVVRASVAALEEAQRIAHCGSWDLDLTTREVHWSAEMCRIFGLPPDTPMTYRKAQTLIAAEDFLAAGEALRRPVATGKIYSAEHRVTRADGSQRVVHVEGELVCDRTGSPVRVAGTAHDITEYRRLEEQFRQSQKMEAIGRLAGGVAHDFNNLLTVINGYGELVLDNLGERDPLRAYAQEIRTAGDRAADLTRQLLAFSRRQLLQPQVLQLNTAIAQIENMLRRLLGEDVALQVSLDPELGRVRVDPGQVEQVVVNLAVNARDAMPNGGRLCIETANVQLDEDYTRKRAGVQPGPYVMLAVSDSGSGMDAETQRHIFEPFFTTKPKGQGTGLGLSTVYGIVKQSGGEVRFYSEAGRGTTFKVYLPRVDVPEERVPEAALPAPGAGQTILVVEDEDAVRSLTCTILESAGYTTLAAANAEEALEIDGNAGALHLMVTDVVMPGRSGRELALRMVELRPALPVLYVSGYTGNAVVQHGVQDDGIHFLQKPFSPRALLTAVAAILHGGREG